MSEWAAKILRVRADSYRRDAEALRESNPEEAALLTAMRFELRRVADEIESCTEATCQAPHDGLVRDQQWCVECGAWHRPPIGCGAGWPAPTAGTARTMPNKESAP
jgi:hypothetical protein